MFCSGCGTQLVVNARFCHHCGAAVGGVAAGGKGIAAPAVAAPHVAPAHQACFQCGGDGKVHRSPMSHGPGCIFCTTCPGCAGKGVIPGAATRCPKCKGEGKHHDSPMSHNPAGCIFCSDCNTCQTKGWI